MPDGGVKLHGPSLRGSPEIPLEVVGGVKIDCSSPYDVRPEVDNDVIFGTTVDNVGVNVPIKFGDSGSCYFRDIRGADFVSNERTNICEDYPNFAYKKIKPSVVYISPRRPDDPRRLGNLKLCWIRQTPEVISPTNFQLDYPHLFLLHGGSKLWVSH